MAAPRATQFIALRNLARGGHQTRQLSMTGSSKTFASPTLERPVLNLPRDIAGLRAECKQRNLDAGGLKRDLADRLSAYELSKSRAFSTAVNMSERPNAQQEANSKPAVRHFNTSRELKAIKDSSTIDFAYLPDIVSPDNVDVYSQVRVPIIPTGAETAPKVIEQEAVVMKPEINVMSADAVYLPMSESSDGHAMNIDFHAMAERVAVNLRRMKAPVEEQAGIAKQIWGDMIDDILGTKRTTTAA